MAEGFDHRHASGVPTEVLVPRKNDVLAEICRAIARSADHLDVVQECSVRLQRYFGTSSVGFFFERGGEMVLAGFALPDHLEYLLAEVWAQWGRTPLDEQRPSVQAMRLRRIVRLRANDPTLPPAARELLRMGSAHSVIAVPISADGNPIGACILATPQDKPLNAADECLLEDVLGVVGVVYHRGVQRERELDHQRQAIQAHNLSAVGELAAGVAHEINNPLSTIVHFSELLLRESLSTEAREHVRAITDEAMRIAATVSGLQTFAGQERGPRRASARVEEATIAIADLEKHRLAMANVDLRVHIPADLPPMRIDEASLRRVLHNLIANARQAIQQTKRLGEIVVSAERDGSRVLITVEDTGVGLSPQVQEAMFRPFFSTRAPGEGTGLGLAIAYGIVRDNAGEIEAENWGNPPALGGAPGDGGARLSVWLPADLPRPELAAPHAAAGEEASPPPPLAVLVVDDEPQVARAVATLLRLDGHRVTVVGTAEEAVAKLSEGPPQFDVVLSDYRMPGIGGEGLLEWARSEEPRWLERLIYMSGDLLSPRTQAFLDDAGCPVLPKPFTLDALRRALSPLAR
jgi:signal transduction histidine kinase